MNTPDGSVIKTVLGDTSFSPGDILEVQELHFNPAKPVYKEVTVSMWSTAARLVVCDAHGNQWCITDVSEVRRTRSGV